MKAERGPKRETTTWFVSGLPEDADEYTLTKHFERIDKNIKVKHINILRSHQTLKSKGVAIVDFESSEEGEKAHSLVNYSNFQGSELHLMAYWPGGLKGLSAANVFVKNLSPKTRSKELYEAFAKFGHILSCTAKYNSSGLCKGYGYVQYSNKEAADKAVAEGNGMMMNENKIEVCLFKPRTDRSSSITMYNNLFVKSIPKNYTNEQLKNLFSPYGEIISAVTIKDRVDGVENKGFGFVCFKKNEDAKTAEEKLRGFLLEGQSLYVARALSKEEHKRQMREERYRIFKDCNIYVKNLPDEVNDEMLKKAFEVFGQVISARVMLEQYQDLATGKIEYKSKNYGFVCFGNKEDAKRVVMQAPTQPIFGRILFVAIAVKKEERQEKFKQMNYPPMAWMPPQMYQPQYIDNRRMKRPPMYPPYMMPPMPPMPQYPPPRPQPVLPADKESLGEILYILVEQRNAENAAKITGMLLEMDIPQIHAIIQDPNQVDEWVANALKILNSTPT